jgi:glucose-6-phosphate isomerase
MKHVQTLQYLAGRTFQTLINSEKLGDRVRPAGEPAADADGQVPPDSPADVGQFFYLYEVAVSYMGGLLDINTYDQPAVELGKQALTR